MQGKRRLEIALVALAMVFCSMANAQAAALGDLMCNAARNIGPLVNLFDGLAYCSGAFVGASGVWFLARHMEAPGQAPLHQCMARLIGASLLLSLPSLAGMVIETLFPGGGGGGAWGCAAGGAAPGGGDITLDVMLANFVNNIKGPVTSLLSVGCFALGAFLMFRGAHKASKYGTDPRAASISAIVTSLVFGAFFMVIGQSVDMMMSSVFGGSDIHDFNTLSWTAIDNLGGDTTQFKTAIKAALTFFQLVGFIAFVRGFNVLKNAVEGNGQATIGQGLTHIIGGVMAINIFYFMQIMDATFGTNFVS